MNKEDLPAMVSSIPVGVSGAIILGFPLQDWIVVGTAIILVYNLYTIGHKIVTGLIQRRKKRAA